MSLQEYQQARCIRYFAVFQGQQRIAEQTFCAQTASRCVLWGSRGEFCPEMRVWGGGAGGKVALL